MAKDQEKKDKLAPSFKARTRALVSAWLPAGIIIFSMIIACIWVFLIPMFQAIDEDGHADYVFNLYTRGLFRAKDGPVVAMSHPFCMYICDVTRCENVKMNTFVKMSPDYGTREFFAKIDSAIPDPRIPVKISGTPQMMANYPIGYYALVALWLHLLSYFVHSLVFLLFAARILSVILFGAGLVFSYLSMRELGLPRWQSSLVLAAIGFLPLSSMVASAIQPDNLSFTLTSACFYFALRWQKEMKNWTLWTMAVLLAALLLTKYHYFCCTSIAVIAMVISREISLKSSIRKLTGSLAVLLVPAIIAGMFQLWISWGCTMPPINRDIKHWSPVDTQFHQALQGGWDGLNAHIRAALNHQFQSNYSIDGQTFKTFWGDFGWMGVPLIIGSVAINDTVKTVLILATWTIVSLTLLSMVKVTFSLSMLTIKGRWHRAFYIACSNPLLNSYFLFVLFMFAFNVVFYPTYFAQGRHWFPFILPIVLGSACYAPRLFPSRIIRLRLFLLIVSAWLFYSIAGAYFALICIYDRYYGSDKIQIDINKLRKSPGIAVYSIDTLCYQDAYPSFNRHYPNAYYSISIPRGKDMRITGWAIDFPNQAPASAVLLVLDHSKTYRAIYGFESPSAIWELGDQKYRYSEFGCSVPIRDLKPGKHSLTIEVVAKDKISLYTGDRDVCILIK